jgi:hypothetical protein
MLLFDPASGLSIRVDSENTRGLVRRAPRVVLFALSNACNIDCGFCSRDVDDRSRWEMNDAFALLERLSDEGTLEVAFGGGEPLAHAGFDGLLARLREETPLAVHVTTNGTLVTLDRARTIAALVHEARVSIYAGCDWPSAIERLVEAGARTCANVIVAPRDLGGLPVLLTRLERLGCADVALLRYVGPDRHGHLHDSDWDRLETIVRQSPLPIRLSACFSDAMPEVPRLFEHGDCLAGRDFLTIGPGRRFAACSFHERIDFENAADLLAHYRARGVLDRAADREGCARLGISISKPVLSPGIRVYRSYSSNNSGDSILVGRFESLGDVRALDAKIGADPTGEPSTLAPELFDSTIGPPTGLEILGRCLLATGYDAGDALAELRAAVWKAGGVDIAASVHSHDAPVLLVGMSGIDPSRLERELAERTAQTVRRGKDVFAIFSADRDTRWHEHAKNARALADRTGATLAGELIDADETRMVDAAKRAHQLETAKGGYFLVSFTNADAARDFARAYPQSTRAGKVVLIDAQERGARIGVRAVAAGGLARWLPGGEVAIEGWLYRADYREPSVELADVQRALAETAQRPEQLALEQAYRATVAKTKTNTPHEIFATLDRAATALGVDVTADLTPSLPLAHALARVSEDLRAAKRAR